MSAGLQRACTSLEHVQMFNIEQAMGITAGGGTVWQSLELEGVVSLLP
jgi:hypothetical protein